MLYSYFVDKLVRQSFDYVNHHRWDEVLKRYSLRRGPATSSSRPLRPSHAAGRPEWRRPPSGEALLSAVRNEGSLGMER